MTIYPHSLSGARPAQLGLIVLQADETVEVEFRHLLPPTAELLVTRIPSGAEVTPETLSAMEAHLGGATALLPPAARFATVAYACTSGTSQIGAAQVADIVGAACTTESVTNPVTALIAACRALGVTRLALLSPYVAAVSDRLRGVLAGAGVETPVFGSFDVAEEARVVRIDAASILDAATALMADAACDALFLSCTNLRTLDVIGPLEEALDCPVLSSNTVLAWHMAQLSGVSALPTAPGRLFQAG